MTVSELRAAADTLDRADIAAAIAVARAVNKEKP